MDTKEHILIVDDDRIIADNLKTALIEEGYEVVAVNKAYDAIDEIKKQFFNTAILDLVLPDMSGIELLRMFRNKFPETCLIVFTGYASLSSAIEALKVGAYDYIIKPFDIEHLKLVVKRGLEKEKLIVRNKELLERMEREKFKLEIILQAYEKISSILKLEDLADFVADKAIQIVEAEKASLMIIDDNSQELILKGSKGIDMGKEKIQWKIKVGELIAGWVAREGKALLVSDIDSDPRFQAQAKPSRYKTKSFISLPLKSDSHIIGVINVTDKLASTNIFTEEDLRYLTILAHQTVAQIENIKLYERLSSLAITDSLTNLFNHRYFQERIHSEILRAERYNHALTLAMFDIDSFKLYNDRYGHQEGDKVLKLCAFTLKQFSRQVDVVCRYGGEEFMIILPDTDTKGVQIMSEKIRKAVEEIKLSVSVGIAGFEKGLSKDDLIARADKALYKAKAEGKNKVCVYK
jgi:diguanylate cyclase (GGDEF)-like protein